VRLCLKKEKKEKKKEKNCWYRTLLCFLKHRYLGMVILSSHNARTQYYPDVSRIHENTPSPCDNLK
jgi:hypothetical protein